HSKMANRLSGIAEKLLQSVQNLSKSQTTRNGIINEIIRVDHAGELAADRIYAGQLAVLKNTPSAPSISRMWEEEKNHLDEMERLSATHSVSPSILSPIFALAGYTLGMTSALGGKKGAMGCTMAVEELIGSHYNEQIKKLIEVAPEEKKLLETLSKLRDDEMNHYEVGRENEGEKSSLFSTLKPIVQTGCKIAMKIAEKV
ncbi:clk-1, partial [Pristionchus pacificus]